MCYPRRLAGYRTLGTGAASGIGQATVLRLLDEGATVVGAATSPADGLIKYPCSADEAAIGNQLTTIQI
uniref:Dhy n=1 Tax=Mycobacterium leprae TaxID=1769 RepID=Q50162_MYCLR|nr:dhy [Mycobacterium leprae]